MNKFLKKAAGVLLGAGIFFGFIFLQDKLSDKENLALPVYKHVETGIPATVVLMEPLGEDTSVDHRRAEGTENSRIVAVKLDGRSGTWAAYLGHTCGERIPMPGDRVTVELHVLNSDGPVIGLQNGNRPATNIFLECRK